MSGKIELLLPYSIGLLSVIAAATDVWKGRIYNWLTLPAMVLGFLALTISAGSAGSVESLSGVGAGLALYGGLFAFGILGGGDVKLLMAFGAWGGARYAFHVALLAIVVGGVLGLLQLIIKGGLLDFSRRMYRFLLTITVRELEIQQPKLNKNLKLPFGISMAIAAIWVFWENPWVRWGILP